ncbi:hypothetical protein L1887_55179 [Cichorium endivia]|nr:hypothetical protein L1887_55179 [Cichorium endivia]
MLDGRTVAKEADDRLWMPDSEEAELGSGRGGEVVQWCSCASAVLASADVEWTHRRVRAVLMRRPRCCRCGAHGDGAAARLNTVATANSAPVHFASQKRRARIGF